MKTQKELTQLLAKQVEEINLSQQVELAEKKKSMAYRTPYSQLGTAWQKLLDTAIFGDDKKIIAIVKKIEKADGELYEYLNKNYIW